VNLDTPVPVLLAAFRKVRDAHEAFTAAHNIVKGLLEEEFAIVDVLDRAMLVLSADHRMLSLRTEDNKHVLYVFEIIQLEGVTLYLSPGYLGRRQIASVIEPIETASVLLAARLKQHEADMDESSASSLSYWSTE